MGADNGGLYRTIINNAREMILLIDSRGYIKFVNKYVEEITGLCHDSWVGTLYEDALLPEDLKSVRALFQKTLSGDPISFETRIFSHNKNVVWLSIDAKLMRESNGENTVICFARVITNQKLNEHKLNLFKRALDCSTNAVGIATPTGEHWYQNRAFDQMFGQIDPDPQRIYCDKKKGRTLFKVLKSGKEYHGEFEMFDRSKDIINVLIDAYPLVDQNGKIIGLAGIHSDITSFKESEKKLHESETLYQNIFDTSLAGLWRTRISDGKFLKANLTTAHYLGFNSLEKLLSDGNASDFYQDKNDRKLYLKELRNNGVVKKYYLPFRLKDGRERDFLVSAKIFPEKGYIEGIVTDITDQKQAEKAFAELEEDLSTTLNSIGDAVIATDRSGNVVRMNPAAETLTGWSICSAEDKHLSKVFPVINPISGDSLPDPVETILKTGKNIGLSGNTLLITKDGKRKWITSSGAPIRNSKGSVTGVVLVFRDITDEHEIRESLQSSQERFHSLAELLPIGIFECDPDYTITFVNSAGLDMFGYNTNDYVIGLSGLKAFTKSSQVKVWKNAGRRLKGQNIRVVEYDCLRKNGKGFPVLFYVNPLFDNMKKHIGFRGAMIDISERKNAEEELRESEKFSTSLLKNAPHAITVVNSDYSLKYVNPAFEKLTGYPADEALDLQPPYPWWPADRTSDINQSMQKLLNGETQNYEELFISKSGKEFWVEISSSRTLKDDGSPNYYICNWVETTKRKSMEEELRRMSLHDSLTGLYNRTYFEAEMQRLSNKPVSIVVCDIDGLKLINETMGHHMGDELLKAAAEILRESFRKSDVIARIGGDEFAVFLPNTNTLVTQTCCKRVRKKIKKFNSLGNKFHLSISVGYAVREESYTDLKELYKIADHNMYREKLQQSHSSRCDIVQSLIKAIEARSRITNTHADRLQKLTARLGKKLGLSDVRLSDLKLLCRFHNLGTVGIPDDILFKTSSLTSEEFREIKGHCEIGYRIALSVSDLAPIADLILKHHEWWNGGGYPLGLKGEEIPVECRILAIIDAYETMLSERPYRNPMSQKNAVDELRKCAGEQFDPELVNYFLIILNTSK
ncbi:PAS domain S-box protein [bacterium]|nr:PAS domain S-box protein [bacterium]